MSRPSAHAKDSVNAAFGSRTDIGCVREHNEDSLIVAPPLYAVADGMGGHAAGEVASEIAVRTLADLTPPTADTEALAQAVASSNYAVINAARAKGRAGMGTTLTAAVLEKERLAIAQVGDSRAYLMHAGKLQQLTRDHSLMADMIEAGELSEEEARTHPQRSVITRALGSDPDMQPDLYELNVAAGDRLLLCSDGLSTMVSDDEILNTLMRVRDPQRCASTLVNQAIAEGGHDNITVIVVDVEGNAAAKQRKSRRKSRAWAIFIVLLLAAVVAGVLYGGYQISQHTAYLTAQDGKVAVYQGTPDTVLGMSLSHLDHVTDVNVSDLQPGTANRLEQGVIRVDNMEAANALVAQYEQEIAEEAAKKAEKNKGQKLGESGDAAGATDEEPQKPETDQAAVEATGANAYAYDAGAYTYAGTVTGYDAYGNPLYGYYGTGGYQDYSLGYTDATGGYYDPNAAAGATGTGQ